VGSQRGGCILEGAAAEELLAQSSAQQFYASGNEPIVATSGDRYFDYALAQTLSRLTDVLDVLPGFAYYDGENAYATRTARLSRGDGAVLFGMKMLKKTLQEPEHPDVAVAAVCAHEYGHIVQFKFGLLRQLLSEEETVRKYELNADFLAGYYAGVRTTQKSDYPAMVFSSKLRSLGDYNVRDKEHHGLPEERAAAVARGFDTAFLDRQSLPNAIQTSIRYVLSL
jgi:hypothetical protein